LYYGYFILEQNAGNDRQEPTKTLQIPARQLDEAAFLDGLDPNIITLEFDKADELSSEI
jgi:hypothetical protein